MLLLANTTEVSLGVTLLFSLLLVGLISCLALEEKIHAKKSVIAGSFAVVCLLLGAAFHILPFGRVVVGSYQPANFEEVEGDYVEPDGDRVHVDVESISDQSDPDTTTPSESAHEAHQAHHALHVDGHEVSMPVYIPAIDWGVIAIILGSSLFVDITSRSGLFTWIAIRVTKLSKGDPLLLLIAYAIMTVVFSAVLNNVTAMIIVGSLTAVSLSRLARKELLLGFLLIEGLLTNVGGLLTLISSVPNIIVGTAANISFVTFFLRAAPYVVVATMATLVMGAWVFKVRRLSTEAEKQEALQLVAGFDENDGIQSVMFFRFGAIMLGLFIAVIATTSVLPLISDLEMGFVALAFAAVMLWRYKSDVDQFYKAVDWDLLGFFMALFVVINVMEHAKVLDLIGVGVAKIIDWGDIGGTATVLISAAGFSSVTDNIPLAAMLAKILSSLGTPDSSALWWSVIFGANLGGNITPIGSASTLVAVTIIHKNELEMSFGKFVKIAAPFALLHLALATAYVLLFLR
ncbi:MAG: SLC13 family permease [Pirellulaceae bacterium]